MIVNTMHAGTLDVRLIQGYNQMAYLVLTAKINLSYADSSYS